MFKKKYLGENMLDQHHENNHDEKSGFISKTCCTQLLSHCVLLNFFVFVI